MLLIEKGSSLVTSTDVAGLGGNPWKARLLYARAGFNAELELIPFPISRGDLLTASRGFRLPFKIAGVHGQLGTTRRPKDHPKGPGDWLKVQVADNLIPGSEGLVPLIGMPFNLRIEMAGCFQNRAVYFNVHNRLARKTFGVLAGFFKGAAFSYLAIENGIEKGDLERTRTLVKEFREAGLINTGGTLDLAHAVLERAGGLSFGETRRVWKQILPELRNDFEQIHLPIGLDRRDSLPVSEMLTERRMLTDLGWFVREKGLRVIMENQHGVWGVKNTKEEMRRLRGIGEGLLKVGVLREQDFDGESFY